GDVRKLVTQAVRDALLDFHAASQPHKAGMPVPQLPSQPSDAADPALAKSATTTAPAQPGLPAFPPELQPAGRELAPSAAQPTLPMGFRPIATPRPTTTPSAGSLTGQSHRATSSTEPATRSTPSPASPALPLLSVPLRLVGVIGKL